MSEKNHSCFGVRRYTFTEGSSGALLDMCPGCGGHSTEHELTFAAGEGAPADSFLMLNEDRKLTAWDGSGAITAFTQDAIAPSEEDQRVSVVLPSAKIATVQVERPEGVSLDMMADEMALAGFNPTVQIGA